MRPELTHPSLLRATPLAPEQPRFPDEVESRLAGYEKFLTTKLGFRPAPMAPRYLAASLQYSLDVQPVVATNPHTVTLYLSGVLGRAAALDSRTFGYSYAHTGLVLSRDAHLSRPKRTTVHVIDAGILDACNEEIALGLVSNLNRLFVLTNHDPLHSVSGLTGTFASLDKHIRFGGVEFAPLVVQALYVQDRIARDSTLRSDILEDCRKYVACLAQMRPVDGTRFGGAAAQMYGASLLLRQLLIVLPEQHEIVQFTVRLLNENVFAGKVVNVKPDRARNALTRDFSKGQEEDSVPAGAAIHTNRTTPYDHGRGSILGEWLTNRFCRAFGRQINVPAFLALGDVVLLDTLIRGHGIHAVASGLSSFGGDEVARECCLSFARQ